MNYAWVLSLVFFLLNLNVIVGEEIRSLPAILSISTSDKRTIHIQFENKLFFYCVSDNNEVFHSVDQERYVLILNTPDLTFTPYPDNHYTFSNFKFYDQITNHFVGEITFRYRPGEPNKKEYVTVAKCTFPFLKVQDEYTSLQPRPISAKDKERLLKKVLSWNENALETILSSSSDIIERCSLITQFIWSSKPLIGYSSPDIQRLSLLNCLEGLEQKQFSLICGGFAWLFAEIAHIFMPDIRVRIVHGFECHYPSVYQNIHVNSHAFVEVQDHGQWIYIDPFFQLYIKNKEGRLLNSLDIRYAIETGSFKDVVPTYFNVDCYRNSRLGPDKLLDAYRFSTCFGWLCFQQFPLKKS
jgi:hypothetical protein